MAIPRFTRFSRSLSVRLSAMSNTYCTTRRSSSTVDEREITHFNTLSSNWWDKNDIKPLLAMNQLRVPFVRDGLINKGAVKPEYVNTAKPLKDLNILDVGCGVGILAEALARLGSNVTGLDAGSEVIEIAKQHAALDLKLTNLTYEFSTIEKHVANNTEKYDAVVSSEVIEHITEKKLFVEACVKCLKPGGSIFFTTFNKTTKAWFLGVIVAEYVVRAVPRGTHDYEKFIAPHQLQRILEDYNCHTMVIHGMWYNFFANKWSWTPDNSLSYALQAIKN